MWYKLEIKFAASSFYWSLNQSEYYFENFCENFDQTNPFLTVVIGDFNAKFNKWYIGDTKIFERSKIEIITSQFGLQQIINESNYIQNLHLVLVLSSPPKDIFWKIRVSLTKFSSPYSICYNKWQNTLSKVRKSTKTGQDQKTLISSFAQNLTAVVKLNFWRVDWTLVCVSTQFLDFLFFSNFLRS